MGKSSYYLKNGFNVYSPGINPLTLKGRNVCVVVGSALSDAEAIQFINVDSVEGYGMVGHSRTMLANRISYFFNFTGMLN